MTAPAIQMHDHVRMPVAGTLEGRRVFGDIGRVIDVTVDLVRIQWPQGHATWEPRDQVIPLRQPPPWHAEPAEDKAA